MDLKLYISILIIKLYNSYLRIFQLNGVLLFMFKLKLNQNPWEIVLLNFVKKKNSKIWYMKNVDGGICSNSKKFRIQFLKHARVTTFKVNFKTITISCVLRHFRWGVRMLSKYVTRMTFFQVIRFLLSLLTMWAV